MNLFADFVHNIMDGIALGIVFMGGEEHHIIESTLIAVYIHELSQELGDAGVLLKANFSNAQTLLCNGLVNCSAIIGCIIGLVISESINEIA